MVNLIHNKINQTNTTKIINSKPKDALIEQFQKVLVTENVTSTTILNPRFKKIYFKLFKSSVTLFKTPSEIPDKLKKPADQDIPRPPICLIGE